MVLTSNLKRSLEMTRVQHTNNVHVHPLNDLHLYEQSVKTSFEDIRYFPSVASFLLRISRCTAVVVRAITK